MEWLSELLKPESLEHASVAHSVLILALVAALGLTLGSIKIKGISIGVAGVLFAGIIFGHFGLTIPAEVLEFVREFGLILFVYTIGIQVGPGFLGSLRRQGLRLNALAAAVVILGVLVTLGIHFFGGVPLPAAVGLFSGGTTNTPSLAAAQQALRDRTTVDAIRVLPGLGYAVAYPFGVIGIILVQLLFKKLFRVDLPQENQFFLKSQEEDKPKVSRRNLEVTNPNLDGVQLKDIPGLQGSGVAVARMRHEGKVQAPEPETRLTRGDVLLLVGPAEKLEQMRIVIGANTDVDLMQVPSNITSRRLIVTHRGVLGKNVDELDLMRRYRVALTRITRADIELPVSPQVRLQFGDTVLAVGASEDIDAAAKELGNSPKALNHPILVPVFVGIALGVIVGSWPFFFPGMPAALKLGLAGGPLLVAIILSRLGKVGPLVWYMPVSANFMLREVGIALFLACVGLKAGDRFVATLMSGEGFYWMALAALITVVPLLLVGLFARLVFKMNYLSMCGVFAGSMTDPPALAFVTSFTGSDGPSIAYATVYPLTMFLRVLMAQFIVIAFFV